MAYGNGKPRVAAPLTLLFGLLTCLYRTPLHRHGSCWIVNLRNYIFLFSFSPPCPDRDVRWISVDRQSLIVRLSCSFQESDGRLEMLLWMFERAQGRLCDLHIWHGKWSLFTHAYRRVFDCYVLAVYFCITLLAEHNKGKTCLLL